GLDTAGAYAVQEQYVSLRRAGGANVVGRKIGCTARALQQMFGIDTPDFGHLLDDMRVEGDALIELDRLIEPMVEPEIAFLLGSDLEGPHATPEDVLRATAAVMPAIEIIDSRIVGWNIAFEDTVADNGSSALFVLGKERELEAGLDLGGESVSLRRDGSEFDSDRATAVLGHPLNSVAWLVNALAEFGRGMHAGEVVLSGSITKAARVRGGEVYEAIFSTLGRVGCRFKNGEGGSEGA
ncbi:MAG TPA: 2-keto-4-pentenoate hydratase, partial [Acidimicrobiales bacterium]|nr:2-keto-4-pentenoate hydratase [Acidimicrobiales bacterium]